MNSHSDAKKKRVAHIGNEIPNDKTNHGDDVVSDILKSMDSKTMYKERGIISYKQLEDYRNREQTATSSSGFSFNHTDKICAMQSKKFLPEKKHPLMVKCQKNLQYIKHNRSMPKPRAHVGIIPVPSTKPILESKNLDLLREEKFNKRKVKIKNPLKRNRQLSNAPKTNNNGIKYDTKRPCATNESNPLISDSIQNLSDSESDFENFIRSQKQFMEPNLSDSDFETSDFISKNSKPKKRKKKRTHRGHKDVSHSKFAHIGKIKTKGFKQSSLSNLEKNLQDTVISEINEIPPDPVNKEKNELSDSSTNFDCDIYEDTTDSVYSDKSLKLLSTKSGNEIQMFDSNFSIDLSKPESQCYVSKHFSCIVKILRNPILDKELLLDLSLERANAANETISQHEDFGNHFSLTETQINASMKVDEITLDSDEDCTILCEVPKSNVSIPVSIPSSNFSSVPSQNTFQSGESLISSFYQGKTDTSLHAARLSGKNPIDVSETIISPSLQKTDTSIVSGNPAIISNTQCVLQQKSSKALCSTSKNNRVDYSNFNNIKTHVGKSESNTEFNIQILSVTSLIDNSSTCASKDSHDHTNFLRSTPESTMPNVTDCSNSSSVENNSNASYIGDLKRFSCAADIQKDHFKYANFYCELPNFVPGNNDGSLNNNEIDSVPLEVRGGNKQTGDCISNSTINEILDKIDIKTVNQVLEQYPNRTESHNPDSIPSPRRDILPYEIEKILEDSSSSVPNPCNISQSCNLSEICTNIPEIINKIDFKKILTIANNEKTIPNSEEKCVQTSSVCSESSNTLLVTSKTLQGGPVENKCKFEPGEAFWKHLNAVVANKNLPENNSANLSNYPVKIKQRETNVFDSSIRGTNVNVLNQFNINEATLPVIESELKLNESKNIIKTNSIKVEKFIESPSDELDIFATTNIREFSEPKEKDVLPLFNLYTEELKKYNKIMSAERSVSAGLRMLEENQANRIKYLETAIRNVVKHDPCFYKVSKEAQLRATTEKQLNSSDGNEQPKQNVNEKLVESTGFHPSYQRDLPKKPSTLLNNTALGEGCSKQILACSNCTRAAVFKCQGCERAFYCSRLCAIDYWKRIHHLNCS